MISAEIVWFFVVFGFAIIGIVSTILWIDWRDMGMIDDFPWKGGIKPSYQTRILPVAGIVLLAWLLLSGAE